MKAVIRFIVELHGVQTRLRNYWLSIESLANSVGRNCPPPPPPPPPRPPCPAAEKLIVDACKRDAQRFIIWKLEGPLTKDPPPPPFFFFLEEPNPLFARDVLLLRIKKEEQNRIVVVSSLLSMYLRAAIREISMKSWWMDNYTRW